MASSRATAVVARLAGGGPLVAAPVDWGLAAVIAAYAGWLVAAGDDTRRRR